MGLKGFGVSSGEQESVAAVTGSDDKKIPTIYLSEPDHFPGRPIMDQLRDSKGNQYIANFHVNSLLLAEKLKKELDEDAITNNMIKAASYSLDTTVPPEVLEVITTTTSTRGDLREALKKVPNWDPQENTSSNLLAKAKEAFEKIENGEDLEERDWSKVRDDN